MSFELKGNEEAYGYSTGSSRKRYNIRNPVGLTQEAAVCDIASKLPFDILVQIFDEYLAEETPEYPVEILLFVCKSWHQAALDHLHLWSTFAIKSDGFNFWRSCIPRRLSLCPSDRLLDIMIIVIDPPGERTPDRNSLYHLYHAVLSLLTGPAGEVACRWRRFTAINYDNSSIDSYNHEKLTQCFAFPTPNLQYLSLIRFRSSSPIFPETTSLKCFHARNVKLPAFPDLSSVVDALFVDCDGFESSLTDAPHIVTLHIGITSSNARKRSRFSRAFPKLKLLNLWGELNDDEIRHFSAPALERLEVVIFDGSSPVWSILACKGIPLEQIWELDIYLGNAYGQYTRFRDRLCQLLCAAKNVSVLKITDAGTLVIVIKLLKTECQSLYNDRAVILQAGGGIDAVLEPGKAKGPILDALLEKVPGAKLWWKPLENL